MLHRYPRPKSTRRTGVEGSVLIIPSAVDLTVDYSALGDYFEFGASHCRILPDSPTAVRI